MCWCCFGGSESHSRRGCDVMWCGICAEIIGFVIRFRDVHHFIVGKKKNKKKKKMFQRRLWEKQKIGSLELERGSPFNASQFNSMKWRHDTTQTAIPNPCAVSTVWQPLHDNGISCGVSCRVVSVSNDAITLFSSIVWQVTRETVVLMMLSCWTGLEHDCDGSEGVYVRYGSRKQTNTHIKHRT